MNIFLMDVEKNVEIFQKVFNTLRKKGLNNIWNILKVSAIVMHFYMYLSLYLIKKKKTTF